MNHKIRSTYKEPTKDVRNLSDIKYIIQEDFDNQTVTEKDTRISYSFSEASGKVVATVWVRMGNSGRGVNVLTLCSGDKEVMKVETEGAYFYTYDGSKKVRLCQYNREDWYSIYVALDTVDGTYSLYIDSERQMHQAVCQMKVESIDKVQFGSNGGILHVKRLHVYKNPIQSVVDATDGLPIYDARKYGIIPDGTNILTKELQNLIDTCSHNGGGVVYLSEGTFLTGCIELKEKVTLYIDKKAVLKGTIDRSQYPTKESKAYPNMNMIDRGPQKALIYAEGQDHIKVIGGGTIDGGGDFAGEYRSESLRPSGILLVGCNHVMIGDLYIIDSGMWTIPLVECDEIYIRDLNLFSCWYPNRDGIDLCDCYDVLVENCTIKSDDDAMCYKSGNESGCDNIIVRNTFLVSTMANGIKFGTYSYGGFTNCLCEDIIIKDNRICAICIESVDGGRIKNLKFNRIHIKNVENPFFIIIGDKGRTPAWGEHRIGSIEDIYFSNILVEQVKDNLGNYLGGLEKDGCIYSIKNIYFDHVTLFTPGGANEVPDVPKEFEKQYPEAHCFGRLPASAYFIRHGENVVFNECRTVILSEDAREEICRV